MKCIYIIIWEEAWLFHFSWGKWRGVQPSTSLFPHPQHLQVMPLHSIIIYHKSKQKTKQKFTWITLSPKYSYSRGLLHLLPTIQLSILQYHTPVPYTHLVQFMEIHQGNAPIQLSLSFKNFRQKHDNGTVPVVCVGQNNPTWDFLFSSGQ